MNPFDLIGEEDIIRNILKSSYLLYPTNYSLKHENLTVKNFSESRILKSYTPEILCLSAVCKRFCYLIKKLSKSELLSCIIHKLSIACEKTIGGIVIHVFTINSLKIFIKAFTEVPLSCYKVRCVIDRLQIGHQVLSEINIINQYLMVHSKRDIHGDHNYEILRNYNGRYVVYLTNGTKDDGNNGPVMWKTLNIL